jgi:hypothetical protein
MKNLGEQFLHKRDDKLHTTSFVEHEQERLRRSGEEMSQKPADKLADWMKILEHTHIEHRDDPRVLERIKRYYHRKHVTITLEDIPQSYWNNRAEIMIRQGYGGDMEQQAVQKHTWRDDQGNEHIDYIFPKELKERELEVIRNNQERSLNKWLDYLTSQDAPYPMWAKYWAFTSILKMGKYDKRETENGKERAGFQKRDKSTTNSYPLLNPRALAKTVGAMTALLEARKKVQAEKQKPKDQRDRELLKLQINNESKKLNDQEFASLLSSENFTKIYAQFLLEIPQYSTEGLKQTTGEWKMFPQGSDPAELVKSLEGYPLEWCTADLDTAKTQLEGGDFYVYYSHNEDGEPVIPRLAIRMQGKHEIAEPPRGIALDQNIDPYIHPVLDEKLTEFGKEGELYKKRITDMDKLTGIWEKNRANQKLTREDLRFLYEFDSKIEGFGYQTDPRIQEIISGRNVKVDISTITGFRQDQISTTQEEALAGGIEYHYSDLNLYSLSSAEGLTFPSSIGGNLDLGSLSSAEGLTFPSSIGGNLDLGSLSSAEGLTLPSSIGGNLHLDNLSSAEGLTLTSSIGGDLYLNSLSSAEGLTLPSSIGGSLYLGSLSSAEGLTLPSSIGGNLHLDNLSSAEGLTLTSSIGGNLHLDNLSSAEGLTLPSSIGGGLYLKNLSSAEGLTLPSSIGGNLHLDNLSSAEGLTFPSSIGGNLDLNSLSSAEGLTLPSSIGRDLNLNSLSSAEGLTLTSSIGGNLLLDRLSSAEGLTLPSSIGGSLYLNRLSSAEGLTLPSSIGGNLLLDRLSSAEGLTLPSSIGGNLYLNSLSSAEGLTLPSSIGGNLLLDRLSSAEGLTFPSSIGGALLLDRLSSAEGLTLPSSIGGDLYLRSLSSAEKDRLRSKNPHLAKYII